MRGHWDRCLGSGGPSLQGLHHCSFLCSSVSLKEWPAAMVSGYRNRPVRQGEVSGAGSCLALLVSVGG